VGPVWLAREGPEEPASLPELALQRVPDVAPDGLAREQPEEPASLPELALQREPDASPDGLAQHSAAASGRSRLGVPPVSVLRGSAERAVGLPDVPQEPDVPPGAPVQRGPVLSAPEEPRWGALPEQQVLRARVQLGEPPPERAGPPVARSACCGRRAKPPDARRGRP
jgi:hypothetical protein